MEPVFNPENKGFSDEAAVFRTKKKSQRKKIKSDKTLGFKLQQSERNAALIKDIKSIKPLNIDIIPEEGDGLQDEEVDLNSHDKKQSHIN